MLYNLESLSEYCNNNNIILLNKYDKVNRDSYIEGKCIHDCNNNFYKKFRQLIKTGAYCKDCMKIISSKKIKNSLVKWDINELNKFCDKNNIILTGDYSNEFINRNSIIEGLCKNEACENIFSKTFREILNLNGYCSNCSKEIGKQKIKNTNIKKYGVECVLQSHDVIEKSKQTMISKYGVDSVSKLESIKLQKKLKSLEKYNVEYVLQAKEVREKGIMTNLTKYGVENPQQNKIIKEKTMNTNIELYGCKSPVGNELIKMKIIQNNLEKYGVPHHSQNPDIAEKLLNNSYKKKLYTLPSGKNIYLQGYENFMLDHLLLIEKIYEDDIVTKRNDVPEIWFNDKDGKKHRHYVDFYIKSQNRCIEVKSTFTNQSKNYVFEKQNAAKDLGLKYEVWIFNKYGEILEKYI